MNSIEKAQMLCLSTAHITPKTSAMLANDEIDDVTCYKKGNWGYFIFVPACVEENGSSDIPDDLRKVMDFARENGCLWVMLDCACACVDSLSEYDWSESVGADK